MDAGSRIKYYRQRLGMSQDELAKRAGYKSRSSINKIELGENGIPVDKVELIANSFDVNPNYITGWIDEFSQKFCEQLTALLPTLNETDLHDAGVNLQQIRDILDGKTYLTLDIACSIADELGESLDFMLGHTSDTTIKAALAYEDSLTAEVIQLVLELPEEQKRQLLDYAGYLAERSRKQ